MQPWSPESETAIGLAHPKAHLSKYGYVVASHTSYAKVVVTRRAVSSGIRRVVSGKWMGSWVWIRVRMRKIVGDC